MNPLQRLLSLDADEKARLGVEATPVEIAQQPEMWRDTARRFAEAAPHIQELFAAVDLPDGSGEIIFSGAGTSDFVGKCIQGPVTAALQTRGLAVPTTDIVTHPEFAIPSDRPGIMVSFARSGNSPESVAAVDIELAERPQVRHLIITCNAEGELAKRTARLENRAHTLVLHPKTNDRGLAMTSSFSSMVVAGLGLAYLDDTEKYIDLVDRMAVAGQTVIEAAPAVAERLAAKQPGRACFLGSGSAYGAAVESHLKLQEMTDGDLLCFCDTFLGIRHGPRAAIHDDTVVIYFLASEPQVRRYELDLIQANREQQVGLAHLIVADCSDYVVGSVDPPDRNANHAESPADPAARNADLASKCAGNASGSPINLAGLADECIFYDPEGSLDIPDHMLAPVYTVAGQLLGLFASLQHGLRPDAPSAGGVIHRVVQGVTIYPRESKR